MGSFVSMANTMLGPIVGQAAVSRWFTKARGRAMGIAALGTSIGGMVMAPLFGLGFETIGWRMTIRLMAAIVAFFALPLLLFFFRDHPEELGLRPEGVEAGGTPSPVRPVEAREILGQLPFWSISICLALFLGTYNAMLMNVPKFADDLGADAMTRSHTILALTVAGLVGKLLFGWLADRIPLNLGLWAAIGLTAAAVAVMTTEPELPVLVASAALMGLAAGGILPVWGALMAQIFGVANFGRAMGFQAPFITAGALAGLAVVGRIRDQTGSYVLAFQIFVGVLCMAAAVLVLLRMPEKLEPGVVPAPALRRRAGV
jgi:MFS family permease